MNKQEAIHAIEQGHIAEALITIAMYSGAKKINEMDGLYELKVDDTWTIKCNGHKEEVNGIPGLSWYLEFNGWPAGILSVLGEGFLCAGETGNEDNLKKALIGFVNKLNN